MPVLSAREPTLEFGPEPEPEYKSGRRRRRC